MSLSRPPLSTARWARNASSPSYDHIGTLEDKESLCADVYNSLSTMILRELEHLENIETLEIEIHDQPQLADETANTISADCAALPLASVLVTWKWYVVPD